MRTFKIHIHTNNQLIELLKKPIGTDDQITTEGGFTLGIGTDGIQF
ncbi:MAG: hypothetical protein ACMUEM_07090 [Flavobacteriales bacterium AspAUS03]